MKRGRISVAVDTEKNGTELSKFSHILVYCSGPPFSDFPRDIVVNVLLRLSIKRIFVCKLVCKTWRDLISAPEFAKQHFNQAQAYPLIQISRNEVLSRMLYLVQLEMEDFELKLEMCDHKPKSDSRVKFELDTRFKLPLGNLQMMFDGEKRCHDMLESNYCSRLKMKDHQYRIDNSCNGLLCLSSRPYNEQPLVVCNPVTGEFINLPMVNRVSKCHYHVQYGFSFSPAANQYKVIRIIQPRNPISTYLPDNGVRAGVHTLGTETWKCIEGSAKAIYGLGPTYLNGFLYWAYVPYQELHLCLISFDVGNECFGSISAPPIEFPMQCNGVELGVLGEALSISCLLLWHD